MTIEPLVTLGGLFAGTVVGLTGLGGAAIVTPMLLLIFGVPASVAVSTDLVSAALMKPVGASVHWRQRTPHWPVVKWLSMGSVPGVLIGTWLFTLIIGESGGETVLKKLIGGVLVTAVLITIARLWLRRYAATHSSDALQFTRGRLAITLVCGLVVGTLVGLTSVGSGTLIAASLLILFPAMRPSRLVGTDLVQAVPMLAVGALAHGGFGDVNWSIVVSLLIGQLPGVWFGARISSRYDGQELRWLLLVLVGASGLALLGAPSWLATTVTVVGCVGLGVPIGIKALRNREQPALPAEPGVDPPVVRGPLAEPADEAH